MASLSSPSVCINDVLSLHLLVEILSRLPMRIVFQCKTVCKVWLSCIQGNDSGFIGQFIQRNDDHDLQQKQIMIPVALNRSEMVLVEPSCTVTVTDSELSLDFLPFYRHFVPPPEGRDIVLASNNGLLVCSPNNSRYAEYYICNPLTRQWIALPRPPRCNERDIGVGFTCDPFYNGESHSVNYHFGVKLVRLLLTHPLHISAEVFSNRTGWCGLVLPDGIERAISFYVPPVSYNGKIHLLLRNRDMTVYDPETQEIMPEGVASGPPAEELYFQLGTAKQFFGFRRLSVCRGSFWLGQVFNARVRVFNLVNGVWRLEHDVDIYSGMKYWSSRSVQLKTVTRPCGFVFCSMHPSDPMIAYLSVDGSFLECDFRDRTMKVVSEQEGNLSNVVTLSLPPWPTPLPAISSTN
ncbi:F-box protein At5g49610 [Linum grandiflorum]